MRPVFISGCPRSGTSLLGTALGAHPEICSVPESQFKIEALSGLSLDSEVGRYWDAIEKSIRTRRFRSWSKCLERVDPAAASGAGSFADVVDLVVRAYAAGSGKPQASVWADDTPSNKNFLATLFRLFPNAKAIHIVRDGRAVANSVQQRDWGPNTAFFAGLWWLAHISLALAAEQKFPPERIRRVHYEALALRPRETLTELCEWLGIGFSDQMLDASFYKPDSRSAKFNPLTKQAPRADRVEAWRESLSPREIEIFESVTKEMLEYLGYDVDFGPWARKPSLPELLATGLTECLRSSANAVSYRARMVRWARQE